MEDQQKTPIEQAGETNPENNERQNLEKENIGYESEEMGHGDPDSPYKLKHTLDDKRPENSDIKKGWNVDSNASRNPQDLKSEETAEDSEGT